MMHFKKVVATVALSLTTVSISMAQVGITSVPFLQIEPDSRSAGMGNTGVALADNASALFWNPAGFAFQEKETQIGITHSNWLPNFNTDLFYDYLAGKMYIDGIGTIGAHITYFNLGEQMQTDEAGNELGTFRSMEFASGASYGFRINDNFAIGTGFRFIYSRLVPAGIDVSGQPAKNGTSVGADLGLLYKTNIFEISDRLAQFNVGMNLSNIGPGIQYTDRAQQDPLPTVLRLGWAFNMNLDTDGFNTITIANDVSKVMARNDTTGGKAMPVHEAIFKSWDTYLRYDHIESEYKEVPLAEQFMIGIGAEYWYDRKFALRAGYFYESPNNGDRQFLTFGAGIRYNIFGVDFSYLQTLKENHPLANTIRFSVLLNF
jgi:long-subunit fatty acid transport protein